MPRQPHSSRLRPRLLAALAAFLLAAAIPSVASAEGELTGTIPTQGVGLAIWSGGPVTSIPAVAASHSCSLVSVWANRPGGGLVGHISGAPAFVNVAFAEVYPGDLAPSTPVVVVCGSTNSPAPPPPSGPVPPPPQGASMYYPIPDGYPGPAANQ